MQEPHATTIERPSNHLVGQTSPYLLQHVYNPVDWYPWGSEALLRSKAENKPIFLSIGYSACHWCHVMEHESFENEKIAAYLNEHYISIKVDREERPDLDDLYMSAVQRMTGSGGWPMTVFLTPELKPFFGGTYFPPESKYGRPGFHELLNNIQDAWVNRRADIEKSADQLTGMLKVEFPPADKAPLPSKEELATLYRQWLPDYSQRFDPTWGGFGPAPKFPPTGTLLWLLHQPSADAQKMATVTLQKMAAGGMYDQIGGGFARYSVDEQWLIPHFEKMLYDQGTLIPTYLHGWRVSGEARFAEIAAECCDYLLLERQDPAGGFWSATDADSEGVEGKFFAWDLEQLEEVLGAENAKFAAVRYGVTEHESFEHGMSVLQASATAAEAAKSVGLDLSAAKVAELEKKVRQDLYDARLKRIAPGNDDKVLTAWNGLAIHALALSGAMLDQPRYTDAAVQAAEFALREMWRSPVADKPTEQPTGQLDNSPVDEPNVLYRSWRDGHAQHRAVLEDYAYLSRSFLTLFQTTGDERWLHHAEELADRMLRDFWDEDSAIFWDTDGLDATVLHRLKSPWDGAIPSPNAIALETLLGLHAFTHDKKWQQPALSGLAAILPHVKRGPASFNYSLPLFALATDEPSVAVVIGNGSASDLANWRRTLLNRKTPLADWYVFAPVAVADSTLEILQNRPAVDGKTTLYLCRGATCDAPVNELPK